MALSLPVAVRQILTYQLWNSNNSTIQNYINNNLQLIADCVSTNTANKVVKRDASGNFSAGTITASLTGTASKATNIAGGGAGQLSYQSAADTTAMLAAGTSGQVLTSGGAGAPSWTSQSSLSVGTATACSGNAATATLADAAKGDARFQVSGNWSDGNLSVSALGQQLIQLLGISVGTGKTLKLKRVRALLQGTGMRFRVVELSGGTKYTASSNQVDAAMDVSLFSGSGTAILDLYAYNSDSGNPWNVTRGDGWWIDLSIE